jgi:hypothetical protein
MRARMVEGCFAFSRFGRSSCHSMPSPAGALPVVELAEGLGATGGFGGRVAPYPHCTNGRTMSS